MITRRFGLLLLAVCVASVPATSAPTDNKTLHLAASRYRDAVVKFEQVLRHVRGIDRSDERLVDRFEEATKKMRLAARNPRHASRLRNQWREIQPLQLQVETTIFNKYTPRHDLLRAWDSVLYAQAVFAQEYRFHLEYPKHGIATRRRISSSQPNRFLPPPAASRGRIYTTPR